jgi:hypothetical protein
MDYGLGVDIVAVLMCFYGVTRLCVYREGGLKGLFWPGLLRGEKVLGFAFAQKAEKKFKLLKTF